MVFISGSTQSKQARRKRGAGGHVRFHFLADQLTLSQPGGHIIPTQYYVPPPIFRPCDGPEMLYQSSRVSYKILISEACEFHVGHQNQSTTLTTNQKDSLTFFTSTTIGVFYLRFLASTS